ncbi:glycoprotein endo-alpha-1,2-mannosidase isoform X2 [Rhodnius prolixus]
MLQNIRAKLKILLTFGVILCSLTLIKLNTKDFAHTNKVIITRREEEYIYGNDAFPTFQSIAELRSKYIKKKMLKLSNKVIHQKTSRNFNLKELEPNYNVHIFYYAWYRSPPNDRKLKYWNDERKFINITDTVPAATNYYPELGFYSSRNETVIRQHMQHLRMSGIGVLLVAWYPSDLDDTSEDILPLLIDAAANCNLKIALHIKSYSSRDPSHLVKHIKQFIDKFQYHKGLYRMSRKNKLLPVYYIYDPLDIEILSWRELLAEEGILSIRNTKYDGIFIGLIYSKKDSYEIKRAGFDGFYTYFPSNGATYGSTWKNWAHLNDLAKKYDLLFVPCVAPGYAEGPPDSSTRHRLEGRYYQVSWHSAINLNTTLIAVTSFNAWNEGSQIEPAVPRYVHKFIYLDYEPDGPVFYLQYTGSFIASLKNKM